MEPLKRPKGRNINTSAHWPCWINPSGRARSPLAHLGEGGRETTSARSLSLVRYLPFVSIPTVDSPTLWPSSRLHPLLAMSFIHLKTIKTTVLSYMYYSILETGNLASSVRDNLLWAVSRKTQSVPQPSCWANSHQNDDTTTDYSRFLFSWLSTQKNSQTLPF